MVSFNVAEFERTDLNFVVLEVPDRILKDQGLIDAVVAGGVCQFGKPVVLMGETERTTYGRAEIVDFLAYVDVARLPWIRTTVMV